jgi:hypothetical protein
MFEVAAVILVVGIVLGRAVLIYAYARRQRWIARRLGL